MCLLDISIFLQLSVMSLLDVYYLFLQLRQKLIVGVGRSVKNQTNQTFNVLIFPDAIGKIRMSKRFLGRNEPKLLMFSFIYDVLNDQNVKSDFSRFLTFVVLIFDVLIFLNFDVLIFLTFDVLIFLTFDVLINLKKTKKTFDVLTL